jgi:phosphatidylinositol alpha 1,6-mannosyltransferase
MRVAIVTESFLPQVNGVSNSVRHVVDRLIETGHDPLIIAPAPGFEEYRGVPVVRVRSVALPGYKSFPVGLPDQAVGQALTEFRPDVVHLASPIALGALGLRHARKLGIPTVAIYQTDVAGFARQYGIRADAPVSKWVGRIHRRSTRNLVPSRASYEQLRNLGVTDLHVWGRGVDLDLFGPQYRSKPIHDVWSRKKQEPGARTVVGYVGRVAAEKQVRRLRELTDIPNTRLVVIGDGPELDYLKKKMPKAKFTGMLRGHDLAQAFASLDVFVHTGEHETFCQTIQEAQASGVPVVAPAAGGPLDLIEHGVNGLLYDVSERASLRDAVSRLVGDPGLRDHLATAGLERVRTRSWANVVDDLIETHYPEAIAATTAIAVA